MSGEELIMDTVLYVLRTMVLMALPAFAEEQGYTRLHTQGERKVLLNSGPTGLWGH